MFYSSFFAFLHFLAAFGLVTTVVLERVLIKPELTLMEANRLRNIDGFYGLSAILVLVIGFLRVFYFEKGSGFYFSNPMFHLKLGLFVTIGLLSVYPTVRFMKWKKHFDENQILKLEDKEFTTIKRLLNIELILLILLLFSASLMAKGIRLF